MIHVEAVADLLAQLRACARTWGGMAEVFGAVAVQSKRLPEVFTQIFMIMVSKGVGTAKGAPELGEYGLLRTVSVPRKGHLSGGGYKEPTQGGGSRVGLVGQVVG
jgi:hypothetical protein